MKTQQSRFYHGDQLRICPQTIRELINYPVSLPSKPNTNWFYLQSRRKCILYAPQFA